jgi:hypothetical protein
MGCLKCCGESAEKTWNYHSKEQGCEFGQVIMNESHLGVSLRHCRSCAQTFVSVFTEFIDWSAGDDAQYVTLLPVTNVEAEALVDCTLRACEIGGLGANRRYLCWEWPTGGKERAFWETGRFQVVEGH